MFLRGSMEHVDAACYCVRLRLFTLHMRLKLIVNSRCYVGVVCLTTISLRHCMLPHASVSR